MFDAVPFALLLLPVLWNFLFTHLILRCLLITHTHFFPCFEGEVWKTSKQAWKGEKKSNWERERKRNIPKWGRRTVHRSCQLSPASMWATRTQLLKSAFVGSWSREPYLWLKPSNANVGLNIPAASWTASSKAHTYNWAQFSIN